MYLAILDNTAQTIIGLESYTDGSAALEERRLMYVQEIQARAANIQHVLTLYMGASAPGTPGYIAWPTQAQWRRTTLYGPGDAVIASETFGSLSATLERYEMFRLDAYCRGPGYRAALALS